MKFVNDTTILFKSSEEYYNKEKCGVKPNTIRRLTTDEKQALDLLIKCAKERGAQLSIRIMLDQKPKRGSMEFRNQIFERILTDISEWDGIHIFSWKP
jgi:hypothetical protein